MAEQPYSNREHDLIHAGLVKQLDALNTNMITGFKGIHVRQDITNGKVKKLIVALVFAFGLIIGLGAKDFQSVVSLFTSL
jgi:hypothetical protein